ncbi:hypothetical protein GE061_004721 [Apolygus lucorum]|uniref:Uncharacterized protein n=1 Tax=Apolygus lucorum TaxID=248454 RepID=A0A8S9X057_APOLU|nr:hypothetical protein GE061_004721 [Apolygus lucorum]
MKKRQISNKLCLRRLTRDAEAGFPRRSKQIEIDGWGWGIKDIEQEPQYVTRHYVFVQLLRLSSGYDM